MSSTTVTSTVRIRKAGERGQAKYHWLDSRHSFSFGHYYDPRHMGFGPLRVINDDRVVPGGGFSTHGHQDMEIISYVLEGALEHKDSIGNGSVIRPGDVQRMSAGTGILHSEFNPSQTAPVHFLQIWIVPETTGLAPGYEQMSFDQAEKRGRLRLVASHDGRGESLTIHQDVDLYAGLFASGESARFDVRPGRAVWVQVAQGELNVAGQRLVAGDGAAIENVATVEIHGHRDAEVLVFDLVA